MRTKTSLLLFLISITVAFSQPDQRLAKSPKVNYDWRPGFVNIIELNGAVGLGQTADELSGYYYGITSVAAYQFSRNIKAGAGAGVQFHNGGTLFPLFADVRLNLNSNEVVPFIAGAGGVLLNFSDLIEETRVFLQPSVGVRYIAANKTAIAFSTGLMVSTGGSAERKSYISFKLGVELKFRN